MEAVAMKPSEAQVPKLQVNQAMIVGRIENATTFDYKGKRVHEAIIRIAAPDTYSMPGTVVVQSTYKLGNKGDDIRVQVSITGIPTSWTDRVTGEVKGGANLRLIAVE